jgi:hypothetical protein
MLGKSTSALPRFRASARWISSLCIVFTADVAHSDQPYVWWEGETPIETDIDSPDQSPFAPGTGGDFSVLSGGDWLSGRVQAGLAGHRAVYEIEVPREGRYELWTRKFWRHGAFEWQFNDGPWTACTWNCNLADEAEVRTNVVVNWVPLGEVDLSQGTHRFEWRLIGLPKDKDDSFGFDAFLLSSEPFVPRRKLKPDERDRRIEEGYFAWDPEADPFSDQAGFDLRSLNETRAGMHGRVRRVGDTFELADGTPVRFWGVNIPPDVGLASEAQVDRMMRGLAKRGVNLVRIHGQLWLNQPGGPIDPQRLGAAHKLISAAQKHGIYSVISGYFPLWLDAQAVGIRGFEQAPQPNPFAAIFFHEPTQRFYDQTMHAVLTTVNPYTGISLADDPAVAIVELVNEDSFFFWTFTKRHLPGPLWGALEQRFRDTTGNQRAELREAWAMTRKGYESQGRRARKEIQQQVAFLADTQRTFYTQAIGKLRELGYDGLVVCSNWVTTDSSMLDALERWTYTAGDVIDAHGYFEPHHEGEAASWDVRSGHKVGDRFATGEPERLPLRLNQVVGFPQMLSEVNWPQPNRSRSDMAMLGAAALSSQGADAVAWFAIRRPVLNDASVGKFALETPSVIGAFPASALMFRRGDLPTQPPAIVESLKLADLQAMKGSATASSAALDKLRASDVAGGDSADFLELDPWSYYLGPVARAYDSPISNTLRDDLPTLIRRDTGVFRTSDDSLRWWPGHKLFTIDTPRCVAVLGRLSDAGKTTVGSVMITSRNDYGSVSVIALDEQPLEASHKLLVQAVTHDRPFGYRVSDEGIIIEMGGPPLQVRRIEASVTIPGKPITRATALDANAMPMAEPVHREGNTITLPAEAIYTLVER